MNRKLQEDSKQLLALKPEIEITDEQIAELIAAGNMGRPSEVIYRHFADRSPGLQEAFGSDTIRAGFNAVMRQLVQKHPDPIDTEAMREIIADILKRARRSLGFSDYLMAGYSTAASLRTREDIHRILELRKRD